MKRDFNPVDVELSIENPSIERGAFYRLCFITESDIAPRTLKVTRLQDLLDNGYSRLDLVYNFCVGVFSQQGIDTVYIRAKRSFESYVESYNSDDNSMYYFVVLQTKNLTEIENFNGHLVSSDELKLQFFSQNVGSKILQSPKLVNYYQDYTRPEGGVSSGDRDYYLNKAYEGSDAWVKIPLPDYLVGGFGNAAIDYGVRKMVGGDYIWEIDKPNRQIKYARSVVESGWVGSREESTVNNSEVTVVATKGKSGKLLRASIKDPKVKIETISRELLKGLGKEALDYAIPLIDPEATDWVLDPANNTVRYNVPNPSTSGYYFLDTGGKRYTGNNPRTLADAVCAGVGYGSFAGYRYDSISSGVFNCTGGGSYVWRYSSTPEPPKTKTIPLSDVAAKVIANAESGHAESQTFLKSIPLFAYLLTGSGTEALNKAVLDIDPEATEWVLDPENNSVRYEDISEGGSWTPMVCEFRDVKAPDRESLCTAYVDSLGGTDAVWNAPNNRCQYRFEYQTYQATINSSVCTPNSEPKPEPVWKHIPIDTVAQQVISNAESGHAPSQEALRLSTVERVNIGEYDEALEAASTEIETSWKYLPIYDVAVQVKRNSIAGHAESIEAVNNSLPFELPNYEPEVVILGDVLTGELVVAEVSDRNILPEDVSYGWYSNDELVGSEKSYQIQDSDLGKTLRLAVTYTDLDGHLENVEVKSVVGKSSKRYWESGEYPVNTDISQFDNRFVGGSYETKAYPLDITLRTVVLENKESSDLLKVKSTPLDIELLDMTLKYKESSDLLKVKSTPLDIELLDMTLRYKESSDLLKVKSTPLDIELHTVVVEVFATEDTNLYVKAKPLNINLTSEVQ